MKKTFAALLVVSALIVGFTFHATQDAIVNFPEPTGITQLTNL